MAKGILQIKPTSGRLKRFADHAQRIGEAISDFSVDALRDAYGPGYTRTGRHWPMNPVPSSRLGEFPASQSGNLLSSIGKKADNKRYLWRIGMFSEFADDAGELRGYLAEIEGITVTKASRFGLSMYLSNSSGDTKPIAAGVLLP